MGGASQYQEMARGFQWDFVPSRYNIAFSACDRHAQKRPHHPAIIHLSAPHATPEILTFHELHSQSNRLAHALRHTAQLTRGDRVGIILPQRPETAVSHMAVYRSGGVTVPLFNLFGPDALRYRLATSEAKIVVTDAMGYEKIEGILDELPCLQGVVIVGGEQDSQAPLPSGCLNYHKLIEESRPPGVILEDTHAEDPATLIFTSGTTGDPKGALHAHRVLLGHLPGVEFPNNLFPEGICKGKNLRFYTPADWAWIGGLFDVLLPSLHYGVSVLSHRATKFDPLEMADMMARHQVTNTFLPPTALKLMRRANLPAASHLLSIGSGGESLGTQLLEWGRETYGTTINEFYGQTEANLLIGNCSVLHEVKEGSMGLPIPGRQVDIVDEAGHVLPAGEVGQIAVRKGDPVMFLGYWNNPEATQDKFVNGWMVTGDVGKKDEDGFFYFHGRQDDVINSAGYRIGPSEVEDCVIKHPDVVMCAAIGAPDPIRNEVVKVERLLP